MFKVYAQHDGADPVLLCEVATLREANKVIEDLDRQWVAWHNAGFPSGVDPRVAQMEGTAIFAKESDGSVWLEIEPGEWDLE